MFAPSLFSSYFIAGFECSSHRRRDGVRLDVLASSRHDTFAAEDYRAAARHGMTTARDGLRWHRIETAPGRYDWSSFLPMLRAAHGTGTQVIWDICHYGWPDDVDIWSPAFVERMGRFARAIAVLIRDETDGVPFYCPVNEISFLSWAGGELGHLNPVGRRRGGELKRQLVRASVAAIEAVREVDPRARIVLADPVINVVADPKRPRSRGRAEAYRQAQFEAWDMLCGRLEPELGGRPEHLDIVGANYYAQNQWILNGPPVPLGDPLYRPLREILSETWARYRRPFFIAETGTEGPGRPTWLRYVGNEVQAALAAGVPVEGICIYPITDYLGWQNDRHCDCGLFGFADDSGQRPVYTPLADELRRQQQLFQPLLQEASAPAA
ncbi:MAG TPA: hypothetical protein VFG43_05110 [Geminicoccaceae bacterium]|nr:hypothetical protein [Geminicoccaceae bacterium]